MLSSEVARSLREISSTTNCAPQIAVAERMIETGRFSEIVALLRGLRELERTPSGMAECLADAVWHRLSMTRSADALIASLEALGPAPDQAGSVPCSRRAVHQVGERFGFWQRREAIKRAIAYHDSVAPRAEFLACWIQEHVLRRDDLYDDPIVSAFWSELRDRAHPLASLPLRCGGAERALGETVRTFNEYGGGSYEMAFGPTEHDAASLGCLVSCGTPLRAVRAPRRLGSAFRLWKWSMSQNFEACEFALVEGSNPPRPCAEFLLSLQLDCLRATKSKQIRARQVSFSEVLACLFCAAANGGAYSPGACGAYGRLRAWCSAASFVECEQSRIQDVAAVAEEHTWILFDANSKWFRRVAWDVGIAAIAPDGSYVRVLACTDED